MSIIKVRLIAFCNLPDKQNLIAEKVIETFRNVPSYINKTHHDNDLDVQVTIDFPAVDDVKHLTIEEALLYHFSGFSKDQLLMVGIFNNLLSSSSPLKKFKSFIDEKGYTFVNYEPSEMLLQSETLFSFIFLNEFVNYLFSFLDKQLENHEGTCFRNLHSSVEDKTSPIFSTNYSKNDLTFCSICSEKIMKILPKLHISSSNGQQNTIEASGKQEKLSTATSSSSHNNPVLTASRPPPKKTVDQMDPNYSMTFAHRKQISQILKDLNLLKEPLEDPEYLETRERFFEGKISEHVFLQILRRKAK